MPTASYGQYWSDVLGTSFQNLWMGVLSVVPTLIFALVILLVGWIIAMTLEGLVLRLFRVLKLNDALGHAGVMEAFRRARLTFDPSSFLAALVRWFIFLVFLIAVADVLKLDAFTSFLEQALLYIPNVIVAALILLAAAIGGDILDRLVSGAIHAGGFSYGSFVGSIARWSVFVFGFVAALQQLGIATQLLQTLVTGIIAMIAIAGGLAFGLGGKDFAADVLEQFRRRIS